MKDAALVLVVLAAAALLLLGLLYLHYLTTPAAKWKARVRTAVAEQEAHRRRARRELAEANHDPDEHGLRCEFLDRQLEVVSVEELAKYPGIGPVTVSRLREAGLATIADCTRARLSAVPGIGPVREGDLKDALKKIRREVESRFDAGASPQAAAFAAERKRWQVDRDRRRQQAEVEVRQTEAALAALRDRARLADSVTFFGYLGRRSPGLTPEVLDQPLVVVLQAQPIPAEPEARSEGDAGQPSAGVPTSVRQGLPSQGGQLLSPKGGTPALPARPASPSLRASGSAGTLPVPVSDASPLVRLRSVAGLGLAVAKADGRVAAAERKQVRVFLERRYATDPELAHKVESLLAEVEADLPTLGDALWEIKRTIPTDAWPELYQFAVSVADAAGERNTREVECLARVAEEFGIGVKPPPAHVPAPVVVGEPDAPLTEPECRVALDIGPEIPLSVDLIRRQHRLLVDRFAPERFANHGPEFVKMAADKREKAERAAQHLLAGYNEPLEPPAAPPPPSDLRHNPDLDDVFGA
jgi:uncharacterized tellurite resistance protein B-like protein